MKKQAHELFTLRQSRFPAFLLVLLAVICLPESFRAEGVVVTSVQQTSDTTNDRKVWLSIKESGRQLEISDGYNVRLDGAGKLNFRRGGRVIELPEGLAVLVNGEKVTTERRVREGESVRIVNDKGEILWKIAPTQIESPSRF